LKKLDILICLVQYPLNFTSFSLTFSIMKISEENIRLQKKLECGSMPNLMVALPNTGGALCSTPQSLADAHY